MSDEASAATDEVCATDGAIATDVVRPRLAAIRTETDALHVLQQTNNAQTVSPRRPTPPPAIPPMAPKQPRRRLVVNPVANAAPQSARKLFV